MMTIRQIGSVLGALALIGCGTSGSKGGSKKDAGSGSFVDIVPFSTDVPVVAPDVAAAELPEAPPDVPAIDVPEPLPDLPEPPPDVACVPLCDGTTCDDGCGGPCTDCDSGTQCEAGACVPFCTPTCEVGLECGPDGCGGSCGECDFGLECEAGMCVPVPCEPFCLPTWLCGPDGCGGQCGACGEGYTCNNAKHTCSQDVVLPPSGAFGSACGRQGECQPTIADVDGALIQNPDWPACVNAQCDSGFCLEPACSQECTIALDEVDWQGNPGGDGVEDPESPSKVCASAEDGPMGADHTCVALTDPTQGSALALCLPGSTFKPCTSNGDCPAGESCALQFILGEYSLRCGAAPKDAVGAGDACNENPDAGPLALCDTNLCLGLGCVDFCKADSQCATNAKGCGPNGKCLDDPKVFCKVDADCSAWLCKKSYKLYTDLDQTFDLCWPKGCGVSKDCPDGDYYCAQNFNGQQNAAAAWAHLCVPKPAGGVGPGEACGEPGPVCAENGCIGGVCSALCQADSDCGAAASPMLCYWTEYTLDYETDGQVDGLLPLGRCFAYPGSQAPCKTDANCGALEACTFIETKVAGVYDAKTLCSTASITDGDEGDACGGDTGVLCKSGLCLGGVDGNPGYCSKLCQTSADCGEDLTLGTFAGTYDMACFPILLGEGGTLDNDADNVILAACAPLMPAGPDQIAILTDGASLADCSTDFTCPNGETCLGVGIGTGSSGPTSLEMKCVSQTSSDGVTIADQPVGAACDPTGVAAPYECASLYCLPSGPFSGYCSGLCKVDGDCAAGMTCSPWTILDRVNDAEDVTIPLCQKP